MEGAKRIRNIVDDLKGFARADDSTLSYGVDINEVVGSALGLIGNQIKQATQRFSVTCGAELPLILGNFQRLEQVLVNLLQNACEALSDRQQGITLTTSYQAKQRNIVITLSDEGVGIPLKIMNNIMDPFFTTKRDVGGTGLGLSVSASIIDTHHGTLHFASAPRGTREPGQGTTVTLTLPVQINQELEPRSTS